MFKLILYEKNATEKAGGGGIRETMVNFSENCFLKLFLDIKLTTLRIHGKNFTNEHVMADEICNMYYIKPAKIARALSLYTREFDSPHVKTVHRATLMRIL